MNVTHFCPDPNEGPSVEAALSISPTTAAAQAEPRKAIIGAKKPAGRKGVRGEQFVKENKYILNAFSISCYHLNF